MSKAVAIVGMSPSSRELANMEPPDVEVWGLNDGYRFIRRSERWFSMHSYLDEVQDADEYAFIRAYRNPVYMIEVDASVPNAVAYPFAEVGQRFMPYWSSTIAYMLALALYEGYDEIHLWGVDMATGTEYERERPCVEFWLGVAKGLGVNVVLPHTSPLMRHDSGAYGLYRQSKATKQDIIDKMAALQRQHTFAENPDELYAISGAMQVLTQLLGVVAPEMRGRTLEFVYEPDAPVTKEQFAVLTGKE